MIKEEKLLYSFIFPLLMIDSASLFNTELTPSHTLGPELISHLEAIAGSILRKADTQNISVPGLETLANSGQLSRTIVSTFRTLKLDLSIGGHYPLPYAYLALGGDIFQRGKNHPLRVFEDVGLFTRDSLLEYKLVVGQLTESLERLTSKGKTLMGKATSVFDLSDPPVDTQDAAKRTEIMGGTEEGRGILDKYDVNRHNLVLGLLNWGVGRVSAKVKRAYDDNVAGISKAWAEYRKNMQRKSDESFARFMGDYGGDIKRAIECMKLAYSMTKSMLKVVESERSYENARATVHMALNAKQYRGRIDAGVKHLRMIDKLLSEYTVYRRQAH